MKKYKIEGTNKEYSEQAILNLIYSNRFYFGVGRIENPSEGIQMAYIKDGKRWLRYIKNPTDKATQIHNMLWEI